MAQGTTIFGTITNRLTGRPVEYASVLVKESQQWAISDAQGRYSIKNVPQGRLTLTVQCLGYVKATRSVAVSGKDVMLNVAVSEENLKLPDVEVVAQRRTEDATTSYVIDRTALDHQQMLNLTDINALLPGGQTVNSTLMNDDRMALRSGGTTEQGNASFGTAVEVDGVRVDNNTSMSETAGAGTRNISSSNIESVEVVAGVPSVEYGDLSNGVVKVKTRRGKSPLIVEASVNPYTREIAFNKGFLLGSGGVLNASFEHARSFSDIASPYTAYQRNVFSLHYMRVFTPHDMPLTLNAGATCNIGGYDNEDDPDAFSESRTKVRDNVFSGNIELHWQLNRPWLTNLTLKGSLSYNDRLSNNYYNESAAATQPYIHTLDEGYNVASLYDSDPSANIILSPVGYWYVREFIDSKPLSGAIKLKGEWARNFGRVLSAFKAGIDFTASKNYGRGVYYEDMRYAPSWRPYSYRDLPALNNLALYAEEKITLPAGARSELQLTAGLRNDITMISGSDYGTVGSVAPRVKGRFVFWKDRRDAFVRDLSVHAGWGKSVKLPSFQVLYPSDSYTDRLAFTPASTADNTAFYAYYTYPMKAAYNSELKWQSTHQLDMGIEARMKGVRFSLSAFYHKTYNPYLRTTTYTPFTYYYTGQSALESCPIASANRSYSIDQQTGQVRVSDVTGALDDYLPTATAHHTYNTRARYINGTPVKRWGLEWVIDVDKIRSLNTSLRIDGKYYYYKSLNNTTYAYPGSNGVGDMTSGTSYPLIGYYMGTNSYSTGSSATATVANGSISKALNLNGTITTHIPKVRMIVTLRLESSLYTYRRNLSQLDNATRGYAISSATDYFGTPYDGSQADTYVAVYPEYYSTWDDPSTLIPFADAFQQAYEEGNTELYNQLAKLVVKTNTPYYLNPNRVSAYFSANFSVTKEIGDHVSVSFYANNFFNNMGHVTSTQTGQETILFNSGYIPKFYYGMTLRLKL